MKLYFMKDDELCKPISLHKEWMKENGVQELTVFEAKMETKTKYFFCSEVGEIGETGESCGKYCESYHPRNGKNGRCRYSKNLYEQTDKAKLIRL